MPQDLTDDKSTLVQVIAWCRQATSHYLHQCWPRSPTPYDVTRPQWVKINRMLQDFLAGDWARHEKIRLKTKNICNTSIGFPILKIRQSNNIFLSQPFFIPRPHCITDSNLELTESTEYCKVFFMETVPSMSCLDYKLAWIAVGNKHTFIHT